MFYRRIIDLVNNSSNRAFGAVMVLSFVLFVIAVEFWFTVSKPVYDGTKSSLFTSRITDFINKTILDHCSLNNFTYRITSEEVQILEERYDYSCSIEVEGEIAKSGEIRVSEYNSGEVFLQHLDCPSKATGAWTSYDASEVENRSALPSEERRMPSSEAP